MILGFNVGFLEIDWVDFIDILLVTILIAQVYKLMRGSIAIRVFFGFLSLYLIYLFVNAVEMELLSSILGQFMGVGVLAVIVLFQQEIRKFLFLVGRTAAFQEGSFMKNFRSIFKMESVSKTDMMPIIDAVKTLTASKTGALVVLSKDSALKFYVESGDRMDAIISKRLLIAIFNKESPMHDGAVIIHQGKILAARCILPVTEKNDLPAHFGLRHRAAIGMTESTDTLVIVVSEETGQISTVRNARISSNLTSLKLHTTINAYLADKKLVREGLGKIFRRRSVV